MLKPYNFVWSHFGNNQGQTDNDVQHGRVILRDDEVRDVLHDGHHGSVVAPGQELVEGLGHVLRGHEAAHPSDVAHTGRLALGVSPDVGGRHDVSVSKGRAQRLVMDVVIGGGQGPGHGNHAVLGHRVGHHLLVHGGREGS